MAGLVSVAGEEVQFPGVLRAPRARAKVKQTRSSRTCGCVRHCAGNSIVAGALGITG